MQTSITVNELINGDVERKLIDVRKPAARQASGQGISNATWRHPFDAANWAKDCVGQRVVVFCVHGHEVSQSVAGYLRDEGIEAMYLEGGFEAWAQAGHPVETQGSKDE